MPIDPLFSIGPSDSGLLDASMIGPPARSTDGPGAVPSRAEYVEPEVGDVDAAAPEESLRDVPLPEGYMSRLRRLASDL